MRELLDWQADRAASHEALWRGVAPFGLEHAEGIADVSPLARLGGRAPLDVSRLEAERAELGLARVLGAAKPSFLGEFGKTLLRCRLNRLQMQQETDHFAALVCVPVRYFVARAGARHPVLERLALVVTAGKMIQHAASVDAVRH
jgi:hypothetical protein